MARHTSVRRGERTAAVASNGVSEALTATDGRVIGERAAATRRRLLDATLQVMNTEGVLDLKVVDITREAGAAPATFYQYFTDLDDAVLALAQEASEEEKPLAELLAEPWTSAADWERCVAFVDAYSLYWADHQRVITLRNLRADEGAAEFRDTRVRADLHIIRRMADMVHAGQAAGRLPDRLDPFATAAGMRAMADRLFQHEASIRLRGTTREGLRTTIAAIMFHTLAGVSPPT